ncbi:CRISPR-associated helicase Cas3' [Bifidobacterium callimiconis]|uniref:CRISPR-associated helicase Cas3' n=1 Tax=Bifidobacterium callimiconis TaxID=2306973 RepID=UPI001BDDA295|nr:CRISPR-associated helicase Cas3' [Bifidobacterium callimiconis]MBT1176067.1 CRISPR-associated helicase Cas3' [Bifidobacterium callimiconis]
MPQVPPPGPHFSAGIPPLSKSSLSVWAKTAFQDPSDNRYLQLWQHLEDTGEIAVKVWDDFVADDIKLLISDDVGDVVSARRLYQFIAAIHDVGKASPAFAIQSVDRASCLYRLHIDSWIAKDKKRRKFRHELVGCWVIGQWFQAQGFPTGAGTFAHGLAGIVAGHHGTSLTESKQQMLDDWQVDHFVGDQTWAKTRFEFLDWIADSLRVRPILDSLKNHPLRRRTQILLTALVIMADWIASDTRLCPLNESESDEESFDPQRRANRAWRMLQLPKPWTVTQTKQTPDEMFAQQFEIPNAKLRPVQREAVHLAQTMTSPGLMIIEANMGEGKTEAALLAAEMLASRFHCGGVYYALPTQATVNAMFTRVLDWIAHLPVEDRRMMASLFLAHGKRELNDDYEMLREQWFDDGHGLDGGFASRQFSGSVYDDDTDGGANRESGKNHATLQAVVNSWFTGPKRGNLSTFVTGTIDQVLMAGLKCKHVMLRHLSLAGKVVILDEIHSNTAYMNVYMETVLSWLGAYGAPVIMLSATLPQSRRKAFLNAYQAGAKSSDSVEPTNSVNDVGTPKSDDHADQDLLTAYSARRRARRRGNSEGGLTHVPISKNDKSSSAIPGTSNMSSLDLRYPLVSVATKNGMTDCAPAASGRSTDILVSLMSDDDNDLITLLKERLRDGGCAVVIRNTVSCAQKTYDALREGLDVDVTLAHSRFLAFDRARIDRELIRRYGKNSTPDQRSGVVVATQVVEQSLDVDFDLMITDIAPIDLVLQRAGRLHRHHRGENESQRPPLLRKAQLMITGVKQWHDNAPPEFATGLENVYQRYLLMRSLAVLRIAPDTTRTISVPNDIPHLVQTVYAEDTFACPETWREGDDGESAAYAKLKTARSASERQAKDLRIFNPQDERGPFSLDDWLSVNIPDPDTPGISQQRLVSAGVRESDDSFEVIALQEDSDGHLQLPVWGDFAESNPLPSGMGAPDRQQVRDILSCTISLGRYSLAYQNIDAVIESLECNAPEQWHDYMQQDRSLSGQLLIVLDSKGEADYPIQIFDKESETIKTRMLHFHYSKTKGWVTSVR